MVAPSTNGATQRSGDTCGLGSSGRASPPVHRSRRGSGRGELMSVETRPTKGASPPAPAAVVVMGVSGCGKSTIGGLLASRLRWEFDDADWFLPASNVDKIHSGIAITKQDRWSRWTRLPP